MSASQKIKSCLRASLLLSVTSFVIVVVRQLRRIVSDFRNLARVRLDSVHGTTVIPFARLLKRRESAELLFVSCKFTVLSQEVVQNSRQRASEIAKLFY